MDITARGKEMGGKGRAGQGTRQPGRGNWRLAVEIRSLEEKSPAGLELQLSRSWLGSVLRRLSANTVKDEGAQSVGRSIKSRVVPLTIIASCCIYKSSRGMRRQFF